MIVYLDLTCNWFQRRRPVRTHDVTLDRDITQLSKHRKYGRESVYLGPNEGYSDRTKRVGTGIEFIQALSYILPIVMAT